MKRILLMIFLVVASNSFEQININKIANKTKKAVENKKKDKKSTEEEKDDTGNTSSNANTTNSDNEQQSQPSTSASTSQTNDNSLKAKVDYYDAKRQFLDRYLSNTANRSWDNTFMNHLDAFNFQEVESRMKSDQNICGEFLMLYPKKIPTSGMGTITQNNLSEFTFATIADANAEPKQSEDGKKIMQFYKDYCWFKYDLDKNKANLTNNLKRAIQKAESAHIRQKFKDAKVAKRYGELAANLLPDDLRIEDLKDEALRTYQSTVSGFGNMLCSDFHKTHLTEIVAFGKKPSFANESEADLIQTIIPGEPAFITGYFAMTNKDLGGIPSLLLINPENKYAKDVFPWGHGVEVIARMFNGQSVKDEFYDKAYFTFNLFPDLATVNYESHIQYIPHLNMVKWMRYLPSEVVDIHVRFGNNEEMALGKIKIDLSGDNKQKLEDYAKALEVKRLAAVTFPDLSGCSESGSKVHNKADLNKYGKVLKMTLAVGGDIMKPWPNDDQVDYNTAAGFAAVEKSSGIVEIMPLDFRKRPTETSWQWWSVGSWPDFYSINEQGSKTTAVKKIEHGYQILSENVQKCGYWYSNR